LTAFCALALAAGVVWAGSASADSLVFVKGGRVYAAQPSGAQARAVTPAGGGWVWPSETDRGIIAVAGGRSRIVNGSFNPSGGDLIYEFTQQGKQLYKPVPTQGSYSTVNDPEYVSHFRVAPDNSYVAYTVFPSFTNPYASWRKPNGVGTFRTAGKPPLPYSNPEWWGSTHLLLTHDGDTIGDQAEYAVYNIATGTSPGWNADEAIGNAPGYQVAISRSGLKFAVLTDDAADHGGRPQHAAITLETTSAPPVSADVTDTHCTIQLPASKFATNSGTGLASMTFTSDGNTLAWGQSDGIYEASVANPSNCASVTGSVHLVVRGGAMPFFGKAPLAPARKHAMRKAAAFAGANGSTVFASTQYGEARNIFASGTS
jgi:hypothetical protein